MAVADACDRVLLANKRADYVDQLWRVQSHNRWLVKVLRRCYSQNASNLADLPEPVRWERVIQCLSVQRHKYTLMPFICQADLPFVNNWIQSVCQGQA